MPPQHPQAAAAAGRREGAALPAPSSSSSSSSSILLRQPGPPAQLPPSRLGSAAAAQGVARRPPARGCSLRRLRFRSPAGCEGVRGDGGEGGGGKRLRQPAPRRAGNKGGDEGSGLRGAVSAPRRRLGRGKASPLVGGGKAASLSRAAFRVRRGAAPAAPPPLPSRAGAGHPPAGGEGARVGVRGRGVRPARCTPTCPLTPTRAPRQGYSPAPHLRGWGWVWWETQPVGHRPTALGGSSRRSGGLMLGRWRCERVLASVAQCGASFCFEAGGKFSFVSGKLDRSLGSVSSLDFCSLMIHVSTLTTYCGI